MDDTMQLSLQDELIADLTTELQSQPTFSDSTIKQKVVNAIREVKNARKYPSYYTDDVIAKDLNNYYMNIRSIALYDFAQIGAPFEESHSENSVSRSWMERAKLFNGVIPISKI